jgi:hypothetical protein
MSNMADYDDHDIQSDEDGEPTGSCEQCEINLYGDEGPLCSQCEWQISQMGISDR